MSSSLASTPSWLLAQASQLARTHVSAALELHGATRIEFAVLSVVGEHGPLHQTQIAHLTGHDAADTTRALAQLHARGLVARETDPDDRRRILVTTTSRGSRKLSRLEEAIADANRTALERLTTDQQRHLVALLRVAVGIDA